MNQTKSRIGNFTSSEIAVLMGEPTAAAKKAGEILSVPAKNYIKECNYERKLQRSISEDTNARPTSWGHLVELKAFEVLGLEYKLASQETILHPTIDCWAGSPDGIKFEESGNTVFDIKSPYTLKSYCQMYECKTIEELRENYTYGEKYFWQLVSNAILTDCKWAELVAFCPFKSELQSIRDTAAKLPEEQQRHLYWIATSLDDDLPYIPDGNPNYDHIHKIRFEVTQEMKEALTNRVIIASGLLNK